MDNYTYFKEKRASFPSFNQNSGKKFDLGYGMVFINAEDKMNDFIDK